jgi:predicted nucleic acid-binding protein
MTVAMIEHHDIDGLVSFDDDFDGVVNRFVPDTLSAR